MSHNPLTESIVCPKCGFELTQIDLHRMGHSTDAKSYMLEKAIAYRKTRNRKAEIE